MIVKNRNGLLSILISVALNGEDASKLHLEKTSEAFNLRPNQRTCVRGRKKPSVGKTLVYKPKPEYYSYSVYPKGMRILTSVCIPKPE